MFQGMTISELIEMVDRVERRARDTRRNSLLIDEHLAVIAALGEDVLQEPKLLAGVA